MGKVNRMEQAKVQNLALTAARSRLLALDMVYGAASGHMHSGNEIKQINNGF